MNALLLTIDPQQFIHEAKSVSRTQEKDIYLFGGIYKISNGTLSRIEDITSLNQDALRSGENVCTIDSHESSAAYVPTNSNHEALIVSVLSKRQYNYAQKIQTIMDVSIPSTN